jgi:hypothetical protein
MGVYSKVLDRETSTPSKINRDEKAGACQGRPSIYDMNGTGEDLHQFLLPNWDRGVQVLKASTTYIRNFST